MKVLHILLGESIGRLADRGLDTYPSVYNALYVLRQQGWENHVITAVSTAGFGALIAQTYPLSGTTWQKVWQLHQVVNCFDFVITYEPRDIKLYQLAQLMGFRSKPAQQRLVHHCLEVPSVDIGRTDLFGWLHRFLYRGYDYVDHIIIQDATRHNLLKQALPKLHNVPSTYVANAYIPAIEPVANALPWFDDLRQRSQHLVCYIGAIERWALSEKLFEALAQRTDVTFLFSGWSSDGFAQEVQQQYADAKHIHFHLGKKNRNELNYLVKHVDVGLVFYDSTDPNVQTIGLSSGKLHKYLSYDKPLITNDIPCLQAFLHTNNFGIAAAPEHMGEALDKVLANLPQLTQQIRRQYPSIVNFEHSYNDFLTAPVLSSAPLPSPPKPEYGALLTLLWTQYLLSCN